MVSGLVGETSKAGVMIIDEERGMFFNKDGIPISVREFTRLHKDLAYLRVAYTSITDGADLSRTLNVSTVWLGIDYGFGSGLSPIIFETAVFMKDGVRVPNRWYHTLDEAKRGHVECVAILTGEMIDPRVVHHG